MSHHDSYSLQTFRLDLAYDGTDFWGWQRQPQGRTVEGCLFETIKQVTQNEPKLHVAGRTDTGVHAEHQVVRVQVDTRLDAETLLRAVNAVAPEDISVSSVMPVQADWDPRREAVERTYYYAILNRSARSCLLRSRVIHERDPLNIEAMQQAANHFVGKHDFTSFRSLHCDADNPVRTITNFEIVKSGLIIFLLVQGHAFLRHMVRTLAGTLIDVGRNELSPDKIPGVLEARNRELAGMTSAAKGLTLARIRYKGDPAYTKADLPHWIP